MAFEKFNQSEEEIWPDQTNTYSVLTYKPTYLPPTSFSQRTPLRRLMTFETFDQSDEETLPGQTITYLRTYLPTYLPPTTHPTHPSHTTHPTQDLVQRRYSAYFKETDYTYFIWTTHGCGGALHDVEWDRGAAPMIDITNILNITNITNPLKRDNCKIFLFYDRVSPQIGKSLVTDLFWIFRS